MTPVVTAPEDNRNFFILKPLLDEVDEELVRCAQMKLFWLCAQMKLFWLCAQMKRIHSFTTPTNVS
jgi:hypothetical protein